MDQAPSSKWYKSKGGYVFLLVMSLFILAVFFFMLLFGYYLWVIKFGDADKLNQVYYPQQENSGMVIADTAVNVSKYIRPANPVLGDKKAPVTILAFLDFDCPYSRQAYADFSKIKQKYGDMIKVVFKQLPLTNLHPNANKSANAAMCANEQGKFWDYYDLLFTKTLSNENYSSFADSLVLDNDKFSSCFTQSKYQGQINQDLTDAVELDLRGTPTYFVNGIKVEGVLKEKDWDNLILKILKK